MIPASRTSIRQRRATPPVAGEKGIPRVHGTGEREIPGTLREPGVLHTQEIHTMDRTNRDCLACALTAAAAFALLLAAVPANAQEDVRADRDAATAYDVISVDMPVGPYKIHKRSGGDEAFIEGYGSLLAPGKPKLPSKIFAVAIPPGAEYLGIEFDLGEEVVLPETYAVPPSPLPRVIGPEKPELREAGLRRYEENRQLVYGSDDVYPARAVEVLRTAGYRRYNLVDVRVTPFAYRPLSGKLSYYPDIKVRVKYQAAAGQRSVMVDNLDRAERFAGRIVINHDQAAGWYPAGRSTGRGLHDFVIITLDSLTSSITDLVNWETSKGRTVQVVTTSWINTNYSGGYDLAENMRNFLRDKYPSGEWGIEDVLLIGHYDDVPMRRTAQDAGYGAPETDFYYAELSLPDDESWDDDEDHQYGESSDPIDFYAEVNVGRIPWSTPSTVQSICQKSVAYEQNTDPGFKKNMLLLGAFFWEDTDNAELMEAKIDQSWMGDWTFTRMYEQNSTVYSTFACDYELTHSNVMSVWPSGTYAFVNWAGHGSEVSTHIMGHSTEAFITAYDCPSLNDNYPAIIFADACSNSDTDYLNIGQAMMEQGAVGFVGATKVALGCGGWNDPYDGSSQSLDYFFTTAVTSGQYSMGEAHQWALTQMYVNGLWDLLKYETFEWGALWGNPDLRMADAAGMKVTPGDALESFGPQGGPFAPISQNYTVKNLGPGSMSYSVSSGEAWVTITNGSGTLANVGDTAVVTVSINSGANSLPDGFYTDTVAFVNTTDHAGDTSRNVSLAIGDNDDCSGAFEACPGTTYSGSTNSATNDGSASCGTSDSSPDVWYSYVPDSNGTATFSLCTGTSYDSVISIHSGCPGTSANELGCDDDYCGGGGPSQVTINVTAGNTYYIRVTGWYGSTGQYGLTITGPDCIPSASCSDGIQNQGEERIDCGGPCPACECTADGPCNDYVFCNGEEWCDDYGHCQNGTDPCPGQECREDAGLCCSTAAADGDMDGSGVADGDDIQMFIAAVLDQATDPASVCPGDFSDDGVVDLADVDGMVSALLTP
jgi:hypothetical protein